MNSEDTRAYVLTRDGWTPELWEATVSALRRLEFKEERDAGWWQKLDLVGIALVDNNYARRGIGKKLAASAIPLYDTDLGADSIFRDLERFLRHLSKR